MTAATGLDKHPSATAPLLASAQLAGLPCRQPVERTSDAERSARSCADHRNAEAAHHYDDVIAAYLAFSRATGGHLKQALRADPGFAMAYCIRGYFLLLFANPAYAAKVAQSLEAAEAAAAAPTERERTHVAALAAWAKGDYGAAVDLWETVLVEHPLNVLALRLSHYLHFYLGGGAAMRDSLARVLPRWDETTPGFASVLGMYAFGLEETGEYAAVEEAGRRAVALTPADVWSVHAVAHVMEMRGRHREGIAWIADGAQAWSACNNFAYHLWWHKALFHLEIEQHDEVLALYDERIRADQSEDYLDMTNAAALLWRLEDAGVGVGGRWAELADKSERRVDDHVLAFADAHYMMALAADGRTDAAQSLLNSLRAAAARDGSQALVLAAVGLPLCAAILAYRQGDFGTAAELLLSIRYEVYRIGGSHAQRDVFAQMLIETAMRSGRHRLAGELLAERTALRPTSIRAWAACARALEALGDAPGAAQARERSDALLGA